MKLSTRVRYGARLLVDVAANQGEAPVALKDVARRQQVSLNYVKQLVVPLVAAGIVRTERGRGGGVRLAHAATDIKLSWVVRILDGSTAPVACVDAPMVCVRNGDCGTRAIWCRVKDAIDGVLDSVTIQDLVEQEKVFGRSASGEPCAEVAQAGSGWN